MTSLTPNPPMEEVDYEGALHFLFSIAKHNPAAKELCNEIDLPMTPPIEAGILQYLFRLQAIGRIEDWPLLFGYGNSFILHLLEKMSKAEVLNDSENERMIWDLRRKETTDWLMIKQ
ncbi:hypothetical protein BGZ80_003654 [Entomortierella chlamydospora]|uniref:Uncharacterized protein n=1 Tax=Entomortierella chlamydospora TaxID=101097 RepID=A0A9P6SWT4_9FUNG|nr:hypothetical protein BGZ79_009674 [Entomortierella chlamydospora]KAG0008252.1 hypothetical protein BGZ80_003654 [Entomortierella chlamydospora]